MRVFIALAVTILFLTGITELHALTFKSGEKKSFVSSEQDDDSNKSKKTVQLALPHQPQITVLDCKQQKVSEEKLQIDLPEKSKAIEYPAGVIPTDFGDCNDHLLIFPSHYSKLPLVKGLHAVRVDGEGYDVSRLEHSLGNVRDYARIRLANGTSALVLVETGLEITRDWEKWPHGMVWLAKTKEGGVKLEPIFQRKAFYHSVATGDIDGDGLDDIVVQHMGTRDKNLKKENAILFFQQTAKGTFKKRKWLRGNFAGGSSVALIDLNGDGRPELLQGNYKRKTKFFEHAVRIFEWKGNSFRLVSKIPRGGIMNNKAGINKMLPIDFDLDGDNDLLLQLEGGKKGLQLHENLGEMKFEDVSLRVLGEEEIDRSKYQWREGVVVDFNNDGFDDIVLQGWSGSDHGTTKGYDLGAGIFFNQSGQKFVRRPGISDLNLSVAPYSKVFFRYARKGKSNWFYSMGNNGVVELHKIGEASRQ